MNHEQTHELLLLAADYDHRTVGESDVHAWHYALNDLDYRAARQAVVTWYRTESRRVSVADVRRLVRSIRSGRLSAQATPVPAADPDDPDAYRRALADQQLAIAEGHALPGPPKPPPAEPTEEYQQAREQLAALRNARKGKP